ncbi:MAG: 3-dehydroquinate dehydratase [Bacteroidia bacterium]|nr:3-dehydroquinate dehydratase [Bacteroidia bacterium]
MKILILNGPNLNLLGKREPNIYGAKSFEAFLEEVKKEFSNHEIDYYQSNVEGEIIDTLQKYEQQNFSGIIINAGGYSHTSVAIADAVASISIPVISVHISNIYRRESERHKELIAQYVQGGVFGLGINGYRLAIQHLASL